MKFVLEASGFCGPKIASLIRALSSAPSKRAKPKQEASRASHIWAKRTCVRRIQYYMKGYPRRADLQRGQLKLAGVAKPTGWSDVPRLKRQHRQHR